MSNLTSILRLGDKHMSVSIGTVVRTFGSRFLLLCIMIIGFVPFLIFCLFPKSWLYDSKLFYWFAYTFYRLMIRASFLSITYKGVENIPKNIPVIFVANHQ